MTNDLNPKGTKCCGEKKCCATPKCALHLSGLLFGIISLVHLYRFFNFFPVVIGSFVVPETASLAAFIIFGLLSIWMFFSASQVSRFSQ